MANDRKDKNLVAKLKELQLKKEQGNHQYFDYLKLIRDIVDVQCEIDKVRAAK